MLRRLLPVPSTDGSVPMVYFVATVNRDRESLSRSPRTSSDWPNW